MCRPGIWKLTDAVLNTCLTSWSQCTALNPVYLLVAVKILVGPTPSRASLICYDVFPPRTHWPQRRKPAESLITPTHFNRASAHNLHWVMHARTRTPTCTLSEAKQTHANSNKRELRGDLWCCKNSGLRTAWTSRACQTEPAARAEESQRGQTDRY